MCNEDPAVRDIEDLHNEAIRLHSNTYIDPATGFTVFTEFAHLKRGKCCGNVCRHCPYGWENVQMMGNDGKLIRKEAKVASGDADGVRRLLEEVGFFREQISASINTMRSKGPGHTTVVENATLSKTGFLDCSQSFNREDEQDRTNTNGKTGTNNSKFKIDNHNSISSGNSDRNRKHDTGKIGKGGRHGGRHTSKNVPYTRSGDSGMSMLLTGERRSKDDAVFEAMGTVDELCSIVGTVHAELLAAMSHGSLNGKSGKVLHEERDSAVETSDLYGQLPDMLLDVMSRLFDVGSHIAKPSCTKRRNEKNLEEEEDDVNDNNDITQSPFTADGIGGGFDADHIEVLEDWIDILTEALPELNSFILPTGGRASAQLHVARCVCRRAERRVVPLVDEGVSDPNASRYLNRLSDFFFAAARWTNYCEGVEETQYKRHFRGAKQRDRFTINLR